MLTDPTSRDCLNCGNNLDSSGGCSVCLLQLGISQPGVEDTPQSNSALPGLEELNAQFPQLEITRLIGHGGMGAIYHARQTALDRDVALKLIRKEVSADAAFVERFEREAKTLAKLSHPHIVTVFDFGRTPDGIAFLIMEYVDGINLRDAISHGSIGSDEALQVVSTICSALEYAHSKGVVHRDIKPENILLGEDGTLKVVDFGIAKIIDQSVRTPTLTATRQVLGSLHYLAPEHLEAPDQVDHRVDLYALGVVFYELLTGQLPLGRFEAPSKLHERLDPRLDAIVLKTLSRKPEQRYQNAAELDEDIGEILTSVKGDEIPPAGAVANTPHTPSAGARHASVPFKCEALGGFAQAVGVLHARSDLLTAEFRIRDSIWGHVKSKMHTVEITKDHVTQLEFIPGVFSSKLIVTADTISALGDLPNGETGRVELKVSRKDDAYSHEVTRVMGFSDPPTAARAASLPSAWNPTGDSQRIMFALLMFICGAINAGCLAISEAIFAHELDHVAFIAAAVSCAVTLGPIALIQLLTGICNVIGRPRSLNLAAAVVSMLPLTPVWIVSFPTGIWACRWLTRNPSASPRAVRDRPKFGATTLMFIRESRWARVVGLSNAIGALLLLAAFAIFRLGYYPTELRFRIVQSNLQFNLLDKALQSRLEVADGFRGVAYDRRDQPTRLTVRTWQRFRDQVMNLLSVGETPQLVWLNSGTGHQGSAAAHSSRVDSTLEARQPYPVASGLETDAFQTEQHRLGMAVRPVGAPFQLSPDFVGEVTVRETDDRRQLILELTSRGREQLQSQQLEKNSTGGLGLVIGGVVEGLARMESISHQQVVFQLASESDLTSGGIAAGIRGPNIGSDLELLNR